MYLLNKIFLEQKNIKEPIIGVIHLAGLKAAGESVENPLLYWDVNINATVNLLEIMCDFECYSLVQSSSATIYEPKLNAKLDEKSYKNPINPYGNTKLTNEKILEAIQMAWIDERD